MDMTDEKVKERLCKSLQELLHEDAYLLTSDASERAITHKLAEHLQKHFIDLKVDCEQNRRTVNDQAVQKMMPNSRRIFPDVIVHRRETNAENILAIELKKKSNRSRKARENDYEKLSYLTDSKRSSYYYELGAFVELETGETHALSFKIVWFKEGQDIKT